MQNLRRGKRDNGPWALAAMPIGGATGPLVAPAGARRSNKMIRKLASGEYRLYSRKKNPSTGRRRNLGTFKTRAAAEKHEREVQYFKRH
jgi:hypothetical protein